MALNQFLRQFTSLTLAFSLIWASYIPVAHAKNACEVLLKHIEAQKTVLSKLPTSASSTEQAIALVKKLPPKFLEIYRDQIINYLYLKSTRPDALKMLVAVSSALKNRSDSLEESLIKDFAASNPLSKEFEFAIRLHPGLHELFKIFEIPGILDQSNEVEDQVRQVIDELNDETALNKQLVIRYTLQELNETMPSNITAYAYNILFQAATQMASGSEVDSQSRKLAADLGRLVTPDRLDYDKDLAKMQLAAVAISTIENNNLQKRRLSLALKATLFEIDGHAKSLAIVSNVGMALATFGTYVYKYMYSSEFDPSSYYSFENQMMMSWVAALGVNFAVKYLWVLKQGLHPAEGFDKKGALVRFQEKETEKRNRLILDNLRAKVAAVSNILLSRVTPAPTPAMPAPVVPAVTPAAKPATPGPAAPVQASTTNPISTTPVEVKKVEPTPKISVAEVEGQLKGIPAPVPEDSVVPESLKLSEGHFAAYFKEVRTRVVERDLFYDHVAIGLLMPKTANIQLLGEPGVAKTAAAKIVLDGILDSENRPSVYSIQMGMNTTIDDLLGTVKPSEIKNDRVVRATENALPGKQLARIDEYYRAPDYTRQDLLTFQIEGSILNNGVTTKGVTRLIVYTSNKYPNQVFAAAKDDGPRAEMDRMLFTHVLLPILEHDEHMVELEDVDESGLPELHFADIDALRNFAKELPLDRYYKAKLKILVNRLRDQVLKNEHESVLDWHTRLQSGSILMTSPEFNSRVLSPRSESTAQKLMPRFAMLRWLQRNSDDGSGPVVNEEDFNRLAEFFLTNSSSDIYLDRVIRQYAEGSAQHQQFQMIKNSRKLFKSISNHIDEELNSNADLVQLKSLSIQLGIDWENLNSSGIAKLSNAAITPENAKAVAGFLGWRKNLIHKIGQRKPVVEITIEDVAQDKALYLSQKILRQLKKI